MNPMITGAIAMASIVISLFFLRFWKITQDKFFLFFAMSFILEAVDRVLISFSVLNNEDNPIYYLIRLIAYGLIIFAIVHKNKKRKAV